METCLACGMNDRLFIVQTTLTGDLNEAEVGFWAQSFVDSKLSSCINIIKSRSIYTWKGEINSSYEWRIQFKTTNSKLSKLIAQIKLEHTYDLPEIVYWAVESTEEYARWIKGD